MPRGKDAVLAIFISLASIAVLLARWHPSDPYDTGYAVGTWIRIHIGALMVASVLALLGAMVAWSERRAIPQRPIQYSVGFGVLLFLIVSTILG